MPSLDETLQQLLSRPREAGTPAAAEARTVIAEHFRALGYDVTVERFAFSSAALNGFPLFGAGLGWLALVLVPLLLAPNISPWLPLVTWIVGLGAAVALAVGAGLGWVALGRDREMREDANLVITRAGAALPPVRRWIVAHLDTKSQRHSLAGRLVAVWWVIAAIVAVTAVTVARLWGTVPLGAALATALVAVVAGGLAGRGRLHGASRGARDNGTGIAALLAAAEAVAKAASSLVAQAAADRMAEAASDPATDPMTEAAANPAAEAATNPAIGFLVTGAEEFGLVGARIFAQRNPERLRGTEVVNVDTVDQEGILTVVVHDDRGRRLGERLTPALATIGVPLRLRRLPLGIFVDSVPLARAGASAVTIGRLTWRTLRRIHTPSDVPDDLSFETAKEVGRRLVAN